MAQRSQSPHLAPRALALVALVAMTSACWTTGEDEVDPLEAQPREVDVRTEAEDARDSRFADRRRRRVRLEQPTTGQAGDER